GTVSDGRRSARGSRTGTLRGSCGRWRRTGTSSTWPGSSSPPGLGKRGTSRAGTVRPGIRSGRACGAGPSGSRRSPSAGPLSWGGDGAAVRLAAWDGKAWRPLDVETSETVRALTVSSGLIVGGGAFQWKGGGRTTGIARRDTAGWSALGDGISGGAFLAPVLAVAAGEREVCAGGGPFILRWRRSSARRTPRRAPRVRRTPSRAVLRSP